MSNISQIQPTVPPPVQTTSSEPGEKDADFLVLRQLNKRARVRLSKEPINLSAIPGRASLFAVANSRGWFAAVARDSNSGTILVLSPLSDLRSAFATAKETDDQPYNFQRNVSLGAATPNIIVFACNDSRLVIGLAEGSVMVYATEHLFSPGYGPVNPIYSLPAVPSAFIVSISPNTGDLPELSFSTSRNSHLWGVGWQGVYPIPFPHQVLSWSPKGKQLALGMRSGSIVTYAPTSTSAPKSSIPSPPSASNACVISTTWLSASSFHAIYAQLPLNPEVEQTHFHVSLDGKTNSAQDLKFSSPYYPSPGLRPPGAFILCLRGWNPAKILLFVGDSTSSDIGVVGCVEENWSNLSLEETSTPSLPLDKDMNDTVLVGLELDLTSTEPFHHTSASGEGVQLPPSPIMYAYASDGTLAGWHVLNIKGTPYPGMITQSSGAMMESAQTLSAVPTAIMREPSNDMHASPIEPTPSASASTFAHTAPTFGQSSAFGKQPSFGQSSFGQQLGSPFGQTSTSNAFGQQTTSAFGQSSPTSVFAQPSFGQSSFGQSSFGQPGPVFGSAAPSASPFAQAGKSAFDTTPTSGGFGAFGTVGPSKFGQTEFGFGGAQSIAPSQSTPASAPAEDSMGADDAPGLGGLSLGGGNPAPQSADLRPSIFGSAATSQSSPTSDSAGGGFIKPATGFGTLSNSGQQKSPFSAFGGASTTSAFGGNASSTTSVFGSPTTPTSAFGKSGFGQSGFGQSSFGTSAFGKPAFGSATSIAQTPAPSSGGFAAFATSAPSAFGAITSNTGAQKPVWGSTTNATKPDAPAPTQGINVPRETSVPRDESRSPSPVAQRNEEAESGFKSSAPAPTTGAFSNLKPSPSSFFSSGFGLGEPPKDSPFYRPAPAQPPVSAFALSTSTPSTPPKPTTGAPAFGQSSMPGAVTKSPFGTTTPNPPAPTFGASSMPGGAFKSPSNPLQSAFSTPSTGGFSAFASGGGGGFSAFATAPKSFGELLKGTGDEAKEPSKTESVNPETPAKEVTKAEAVKEEETPTRTVTPPLPVVEEKAQEAKGTDKALPHEPSLESISSSTASSFVDVSAEDAAEGDADSTVEESDEDGELEDDTKSFISDDESEESEESELPDEQDEEEGEPEEEREELEEEWEEQVKQQEEHREETKEGDTHQEEREVQVQEGDLEPVVPPSIPSPAARSRSTTPKAELPAITLSTSPSPPPRKISPIRDQSTTPPGSPVPEPQRATPPVVSPLPKPPASSPFAITPRTTGTRPVKSSPLANAPLTGDVEAPSFSPQVKSAPPTIVPHPASPRPQFGSWVPPVKQDAESDSSRPRTPPVLFGHNASAPALTALPMPPAFTLPPKPSLTTTPPVSPSIFSAPVTAPSSVFAPAVTPLSIFGAAAPAQSRTPTPPVFTPPPAGFFGFPKPSESPSPASPAIFGTPVKTSETLPALTPPPSGVFSGFKPPAAVPAIPIPLSPGPVVPSPSISPPAPPIEQGMQSECSFMVSRLTWELDNLKAMAARATQQAAELESKKTPGQSRVKADLANATKWAPGDIKEYGIKEQQKLLKQPLKELENSMLKAGTRKEEIIRFTRAQTDSEFAKMLKIRTLGPEHLETQSQLRRDIRTMRDRVQKLEDHLQSSKKRIAELKSGKPSLKAPSLDTVNRTFRNIDISITQQSGDVAKLQQRMNKLDMSPNPPGSRDKRLSESGVKKPSAVIPHVAVTTAAALNAERSAQKLKRALLTVRKEPLLNNKAASKLAPASSLTPSRAVVKQEPSTGFISLPSSALPAFNTPKFTHGGWSPETSINYDDSTSYIASSSRRPQRTPRHGSSAKSAAMLKSESLEASPTPAPKPPAAVFDWGPLPIVAPKTTLSPDVRPKGLKS
ncbi:hypothetical protein BDR07DRAFT_1401153 [Suillus spraguei]|nr:hypothetical protein BDR07DRAFT_1401153 [Suillus spraguei]